MELNKSTLSNIGSSILNGAADLLSNSDFISRTIGMTSSYDDIMFIVQSLGREPISLLGKDYTFIFDHVRRNYQQGYSIPNMIHPDCPKFTFYKEIPTVRFADPYQDPMSWLGKWEPDKKFENTAVYSDGGGTSIHYSESDDGYPMNKKIGYKGDLDSGNPGTYTNSVYSFGPEVPTCDLIKKTNDNFNHGKYRTLVARFHTNADETKAGGDSTQTAISKKYGMSHGRNLLKRKVDKPNGYENPYCRVWTYHHQYNQIGRLIRPFGDADSAQAIEEYEGLGGPVSFRTVGDVESDGFKGGSARLDQHGVLNYNNGFVNIAPTAKIKDYFDSKQDTEKSISIKKCMFSIENLAWRDDKSYNKEYSEFGLSAEQRGPLGGRIMWFPPYDLSFNEDVRVDWNGNKFIGRGEQIYTYTNTERTGSLSFTLLIDHPAILDYWAGREDKKLKEGNDGGVDELNNQENTLLRFFAGCEILQAKQQIAPIGQVEPKEEEEKKDKIDEVQEPEKAAPIPKSVEAILYFPNNYSGVNDGVTVDPILYLLNGAGAQTFVDKNFRSADMPTYEDKKVTIKDSTGGTYNGGYEMTQGNGISYASTNLPANNPSARVLTKTNDGKGEAEWLTETDCITKYTAKYSDAEYDTFVLSKFVGATASPLENNDFFKGRYYYRVDYAYSDQGFPKNRDSYLDKHSYALNNNGFNRVRSHSNTIKEFGLKDDSDTYKLVSFSDLFLALEGNKGIINSNGNFKFLEEIFKNKERFKITNVSFVGHASKQGTTSGNNALSKNRAETLRKWAAKHFDSSVLGEVTTNVQTETPKIDSGDNSDEVVKLWRSASIVIEYEESEDSNAVNTNAAQGIDKVEVPSKEKPNKWYSLMNDVMMMPSATDSGKTVMDVMLEADKKAAAKEQDSSDKEEEKTKGETNLIVNRYDNEGEFFEILDRESPIMHNLITDKIKYFDPAFHSISPEGFNARLTFLHQCTRQGATIEQGDPNAISAYNLAFGRPPVCVLRLGDFYYTKIIISGLNIRYENPQWDLNPEGIGVMPMFANITINFTFLGGSDLAGPIARLQNAVSFNYYANTGVYDNRAEMVMYEDNGSGREKKFKGYIYPNPTKN